MTAIYAVSDAHGHLDELVDALVGAGLIDGHQHWVGRDARLWVLGDFFDRGPSGVGVADLVRRLEQESDGAVGAVLGNHEVLAVGKRLFDDRSVDTAPGRSFAQSWTVNEGKDSDQSALDAVRLSWLRNLPTVAVDGGNLLVHSDTLGYLHWGSTVEQVNAAARSDLAGEDLDRWWATWRRMTSRHAFRGAEGPEAAAQLLDLCGAERVVHGHSIVAELRECAYTDVTEPWSYAGGRALAIDGGIYEGGPCLVARLD